MAMFLGYAWAACQDCRWTLFAQPEEQRQVDREAERHVRVAKHSVNSGLAAGTRRPATCPLCKQEQCTPDCALAMYLGWERADAEA